MPVTQRRAAAVLVGLVMLTGVGVGVGVAAGCVSQARAAALARTVTPSASASLPSSPQPTTIETVPPAPAGLPVIDYGPAPKGFPADAEPMSTAPLTEGLHPTTKIPVYDAPGGRARAQLAPTIRGVPITMPIVARRGGWVSVLLPSVNRTVGWLPAGGWSTVALRDQLVVRRKARQLSWYRDGALRQSWTVTIGSAATPTPLGRTFVLGRSTIPDEVYAGLDVIALGSVPDRPEAVGTGLRGAHIGIHSWYRDDFGGDNSNGCVRVPKPGQQLLLDEVAPGSVVVVVN